MDPVQKPALDNIDELKRRLADAEAALIARSAGGEGISKHQSRVSSKQNTTVEHGRYHSLFENMTQGCALHEIICDSTGKPVDYRFLDMNPAFERLTGLKREKTVGRLATQVLHDLEPFWIDTYGRVALDGQPVQFDRYTHALDRYYRVYAYSPEPGLFVAIFNDISDHKRVELQLNEVAEKYYTLFNATSDGVYIHNLDGAILEVNDAYCRMSGYARDELIHMPITKLDASEASQEISNYIQKVISQGGHDSYESAHRRKDGTIFDVDVTALYFKLDGGRIAIFVRDITGRKQAERRLAYLASFPERNPNPVVDIDMQGKINYANPAALKLLPKLMERGLAHEWFTGWEDLILSLRERDGETIFRDITVGAQCYQQSLSFMSQEGLVRIYGIDITMRKKAEDVIIESAERLKMAEEIAHLGNWMLDLKTGTLTWSDEVFRIFGYQPHEFSPTYESFLDLIHTEDRAAVEEAYESSVREGRDSYEIEHRLIQHSSGEIKYVHEKCVH